MSFLFIWLVSILVAVFLANEKKYSVITYGILAFVTGPLAVIILLLIPPRQIEQSYSSSLPSSVNSVEDMRKELDHLKSVVHLVQERIDRLDNLLNSRQTETSSSLSADLGTGGPEAGPLPPVASEDERVPQGQRESSSAGAPSQNNGKNADTLSKPLDLEMAFGQNWLSKIGIVVFTLGMVFLISYTFKYFGAGIKILFGYLVSAVFFFVGKKFEAKEKYVHFGRVVWGGGWAIAYFTTYAMYHFDSSRVMNNPYLNLALLGMLVIGLLAYVVKYRNEDMMAIALFAAYVAATMGQVTNFTLLSCMFFAVIVLFLVFRFQWIKTLAMSIILTYGIHHIWVVPNIAATGGNILWWTVTSSQFAGLLNLTFLTIYALVFLAAAHIARTEDDETHKNTVAAINFGNIAVFSLFAYPLITNYFYNQRFTIIVLAGILFLLLALLMKSTGRKLLYQSDLVAGVFMLTFALPLKLAAVSTLLIWVIEVPFLLFVGLRFKEKLYSWMSYALTAFLVIRYLNLWGLGNVTLGGFTMIGRDFMLLCGGIAAAFCFYLLRREKDLLADDDRIFEHVYPAASFLCFSSLIWSLGNNPWISLSLSIEAVFLLIISTVLEMRRFRLYAYLALLAAAADACFGEFYYLVTPFAKWIIIAGNLFISATFYAAVKSMKRAKYLSEMFENEDAALFCCALSFFVLMVFNHFAAQWISLSLGLAGVILIVAGISSRDKMERLGGLILFGITLLRVAFVDLSGLDMIFKIITFIVLGLLFLGASFVYNRFGNEK